MKIVITLDALLEKRGISQRELSRESGVRRTTISDMCRNEIKQIPLDNLAKICEALNCSITDVLELVPGD